MSSKGSKERNVLMAVVLVVSQIITLSDIFTSLLFAWPGRASIRSGRCPSLGPPELPWAPMDSHETFVLVDRLLDRICTPPWTVMDKSCTLQPARTTALKRQQIWQGKPKGVQKSRPRMIRCTMVPSQPYAPASTPLLNLWIWTPRSPPQCGIPQIVETSARHAPRPRMPQAGRVA